MSDRRPEQLSFSTILAAVLIGNRPLNARAVRITVDGKDIATARDCHLELTDGPDGGLIITLRERSNEVQRPEPGSD